jgi:hypothetical protein
MTTEGVHVKCPKYMAAKFLWDNCQTNHVRGVSNPLVHVEPVILPFYTRISDGGFINQMDETESLGRYFGRSNDE